LSVLQALKEIAINNNKVDNAVIIIFLFIEFLFSCFQLF
jgi:hypothetical protein